MLGLTDGTLLALSVVGKVQAKGVRCMSSMNRTRGFSLIELMIVVSIIGILGVIAMSTLGDSEVEAMESQVVSNMRAISSAQLVYRSSKGSYGKGVDLAGNADTTKNLIDSAWHQSTAISLDATNGVKRGKFTYRLKVDGPPVKNFAVSAEPDDSPYAYAMTKDGVIFKWSDAGAKTAAKDVSEVFAGGSSWKILE